MEQNKQYKLIAFDIDGTILSHEHKVCPELKIVVDKLHKMGYMFTLVSARLPDSALYIAKDLGLTKDEYIIPLNGAFITNYKHDIIYNKSFNTDSFDVHLDAISPNIAVNYYYQFAWHVLRPNEVTKHEQIMIGDTNYTYYTDKINIANKITLMGEYEDLLHAKNTLAKLNPSLLIAFSHPKYLEIAHKDISKYSGLTAYANKLNINTSQIIAFGDGENDIDMLSHVGLGVAMDNASPHVKTFAKDIAPHHLESGVAKYLTKLINNNIL